jgi:hypothetical protein
MKYSSLNPIIGARSLLIGPPLAASFDRECCWRCLARRAPAKVIAYSCSCYTGFVFDLELRMVVASCWCRLRSLASGTLLDVLALRKTSGTVEGEILFGGRPLPKVLGPALISSTVLTELQTLHRVRGAVRRSLSSRHGSAWSLDFAVLFCSRELTIFLLGAGGGDIRSQLSSALQRVCDRQKCMRSRLSVQCLSDLLAWV